MNLILKISVRNLLRQKRRNSMLGLGIAVGMCLLVMANALSAGISDIMLNKLISNFSAHVFVGRLEQEAQAPERRIIRDKARMVRTIQATLTGVKAIREQVIVVGRVLGNGKAIYAMLFGIEPDDAFYRETAVSAGNLADLANPAIAHPVVLYEKMANNLNVTVNDVIAMRFESVYGQAQTARFTVVAILKAVNPFLDVFMYAHLRNVKPLKGYQDYETEALGILLDHVTNSRQALVQAERLHRVLQPNAAGYVGTVQAGERMQPATVLAVASDAESRRQFTALVQSSAGSIEEVLHTPQAVILSQPLAEALKVRIGDPVTASYVTKFAGQAPTTTYRVGAIIEANAAIPPDLLFLPAEQMISALTAPPQQPIQLERNHPLFPLLLKEWNLLPRTISQDESDKKSRLLRLSNWRGAVVDVKTLHEIAGEVVEFEKALNLVTVVGMVILFCVIQVGVVNTLRMSIRERTREIGTIRAIGMQQTDVRWCFVTEVLLLTLIACVAGIVLAGLLMKIFGSIPIDLGDSEMGFFLVHSRLYFVVYMGELVRNLALILGIAFLTAYLPARNAARLSVAAALGHYE